jgi:myo-inositol-1(or 4)-monophosphatase
MLPMSHHLDTAVAAARAAGELLHEHFGRSRRVNEFAAHDIKLALDVEAQDLITRIILERHPEHAIYGEEGLAGNQASEFQWIVDPLDGTVNYFYGIPHFCVSVALRRHEEIMAGVIFDPMRDELFTTQVGDDAKLNGAVIQVSARTELSDAILSVGLAKVAETIDTNLPVLEQLIHRVRKCRMMGSAALDLAYVACGRLDAYVEAGISLWDVAAGILLVRNAGGEVELKPRPERAGKYAIVASSGRIAEIAESAKRIAQ